MRGQRRRLLRAGAAAVFVAAGIVGWSGTAAAAPSLEEYGWWFKANQGDPSGVLPVRPDVTPPNVPEGGLYVANDPSGAAGVSALRFYLPEDEGSAASLTLELDPSGTYGGTLAVVACPAATSWIGADGGEWGLRPEADCDTASAAGELSDDGATATWELPAPLFASGGTYDVVLLPDPEVAQPFQVPFSEPDSSSVQGVVGGSGPPPAASPPPLVFPGATSQPSFAAPPAGGPSFSAPGFEAPQPPPLDAPGAGAVGGDGGEAAVPVANETALPPPLEGEGFSAQRGIAVGVLAAVGAGLWMASRRELPHPRLLGGAARAPGVTAAAAEESPAPRPGRRLARAVVGGVGRFARPRTSPPSRI